MSREIDRECLEIHAKRLSERLNEIQKGEGDRNEESFSLTVLFCNASLRYRAPSSPISIVN